MNVRDCGQSVVQFGGDDRSENCVCTDIAILAFYFSIINYFALHFGFTTDILNELEL